MWAHGRAACPLPPAMLVVLHKHNQRLQAEAVLALYQVLLLLITLPIKTLLQLGLDPAVVFQPCKGPYRALWGRLGQAVQTAVRSFVDTCQSR